jgi:hypothetical protein
MSRNLIYDAGSVSRERLGNYSGFTRWHPTVPKYGVKPQSENRKKRTSKNVLNGNRMEPKCTVDLGAEWIPFPEVSNYPPSGERKFTR